ncbi:porin [Corticibacter populi]|uniref:Porin n=1 Tax=Corticibacter populi TaxID=1550736 RepID=A0A3M6QPH0_9BURK|nr:porin [Corticibacter populi]RMX04938.1 porin [Corticibacter populi]RZS33637.1 putative porin [Corticibacter populi]
MKPFAIPLAALLTCSSCAFAQSSVQLYGLIDVGLGGTKFTPLSGPSTSEGLMFLRNPDLASRWGIKGSEDLGGGTKVNFQYEAGLTPTTGEAATPYFSRASWVGLSGTFGEVRLGRMFTVVDDTTFWFDINGTTSFSAYYKAGLISWFNYDSPIGGAGQFQYITPEVGGFQARVGVALKDDISDSSGQSTLWHGMGEARTLIQAAAMYRHEALMLGATVEGKGGDDNRVAYALAARYDFGPAEVSASYNRMAHSTLGKGYTAGVAVPLGNFRVGAQAGYNTDADVLALVDGTSKSYELFGTYALSKQTALFVNFNHTKYSESGKEQGYSFGIRHAF